MTEVAENPLAEGLELRRRPDPCAMVIFGASGDLAQRKLIPALYALAVRRLLPEHFGVVGVARSAESTEEYVARMAEAVREHARDEFRQDVWDGLAAGMRYVGADVTQPGGIDPIVAALAELDRERGTAGNRLYYLAIPPSGIAGVVEAMGPCRTNTGWTRLVVEKPFGHDLASARELDATIQHHFTE
ncbi:MAG TPA: hypothetical protein VMT59_01265, partial [Gaiellaceae bacterium]|nr:hypothetical protein [Gaiellaceae bacterium]